MTLRGVSVTLADDAAIPDGGLLREALGLDDASLGILQNIWEINLIQVRFGLPSLTATGAIPAQDLADGLAELVATLAEARIYVLLSLVLAPGPPDPALLDAWAAFAEPFQSTPEVLFELVAPGPAAANWLDAAIQLIGAVRRVHPGALTFIGTGPGGAGLARLPLRFTTGQVVHNVVYSTALDAGLLALDASDALRAFAASQPLFISDWSGRPDPFDRAAEAALMLLERAPIGWTARGWNEQPPLVEAGGAPTRWGRDVRRALQQPARALLEPQTPETPGADEPPYPPRWPAP